METEGIVQFIKFAVVGVANTAVDWIVYFLVAAFILTNPAEKPTAKAISFLVAMINSYIFNTIWTFKKEYQQNLGANKEEQAKIKSKIFLKFLIVSLIGWVVNYFVFKYALANLAVQKITILSKSINTQNIYPLVLASVAAIVWNFFANKLWTYRKAEIKN